MNNIHIIFLLTFALCIYSCKDTNNSESTTENPTTITTQKEAAQNGDSKEMLLYVWVNNLRLRDEPTTGSRIVDELKEGSALRFLNDKTEFTQKITMRGTLHDEPWFKVATEKNDIGWVYGGGVKFYKPRVDHAPTPYDACLVLQREGRFVKAKDCMDRIARKLMAKDIRYVRQDEDGVGITLLGGKQVQFSNEGNPDEMGAFLRYDYRYYIPTMASFVIQTQTAQKQAYILVNDKSGNKTTVWGFPKPSPDKKHILVINASSDELPGKTGIQMLGFTNRGLEIIWEKEMTDFYPVSPMWLEDNTVQLTLIRTDPALSPSRKVVQLIPEADTDGAWSMKDTN